MDSRKIEIYEILWIANSHSPKEAKISTAQFREEEFKKY